MGEMETDFMYVRAKVLYFGAQKGPKTPMELLQ